MAFWESRSEGAVQEVEKVDTNESIHDQSLRACCGARERAHCSFSSATATTLFGGYTAKALMTKRNGRILHHSTGF